MLAYLLVWCCLLLQGSQTTPNVSSKQAALLYRHWVHSQEEDNDSAGYKTYRPSTYPFPPARGRDGFYIKKNGILTDYRIAAADGSQAVPGKWKLTRNELSFTTGKSTARKYKIIVLTKEKLVVKPV